MITPSLFIIAIEMATYAVSEVPTSPALQAYRRRLCDNPNFKNPENLSNCEGYYATMYIYNKTTEMCEQLADTICIRNASHGVFYSLFDCIQSCAPGQGAPFCANGPYEECSDPSPLNGAYFYNMTTQECERYQYCGNRFQIPFGKNGFGTRHHCNLGCRGFNQHNFQGWNPPQCGVTCMGDPPSICTAEDYSQGRTRFYYNTTSCKCEKYRACHWDNDMKELNYFTTMALCELQCGSAKDTGDEAPEA